MEEGGRMKGRGREEGEGMCCHILSTAGTMETLPVSFEGRVHPMRRCAHCSHSASALFIPSHTPTLPFTHSKSPPTHPTAPPFLCVQ